MTLKEFIKKLKAFDCEALRDKEVVHCFVSSHAYGYKEVVSDVKYDAKNHMFIIECDDPVQALWDDKYTIESPKEKEK